MIVRILGEGQFELEARAAEQLNALDKQLQVRLDGDDEAAFRDVLSGMLELVRAVGCALPADALTPSDAILPPADASLADVRALLGAEGLVPD